MLIIGVRVEVIKPERVDIVADCVVMLRAWFMTVDYEAAGGVPEAWRQAEITDRPVQSLVRGVRLVDGGVGQQPGLPVVVPGEKDPAAVADDGDGACDGFRAFYCLMVQHAGFVSVFQLV